MVIGISCSFLSSGPTLSIVGCCIMLLGDSLLRLLVVSANRRFLAGLGLATSSFILSFALVCCLTSRSYLLLTNKIPTDMNKPSSMGFT
jgi:hypothetical protein